MTKWKQALLCALSALMTAASAHALEDGVYRDQAEGYNGRVVLTVTVRGGRIDAIQTENTGGEKSEYYLKAEKELIPAIMAANGTQGVDTVAGATGTSESILQAMAGILEQAAYNGRTQGLMEDVKNAAQDVGEAAQDAGHALNDAAEDAVDSVKKPEATSRP